MNKSSRIWSNKMNVQNFKLSTFLDVLRLLAESMVLIATVLPMLTGFWLAIEFTNASFIADIDTLIITIIGSTLIIAGAVILNNWYEVDLDREMTRTQERPTVTGNFSMNTVLAMGIIASILGIGIMFLTTMEAAVYSF